MMLIYKKIIRNGWKAACLFLGSILIVGIICSIPIFKYGILQRMLIKDLETRQTESQTYPGFLSFSFLDIESNISNPEAIPYFYDKMEKDISLDTVVPVKEKTVTRTLRQAYYIDETRPRANSFTSKRSVNIQLESREGFEQNVELVAGRMPEANSATGDTGHKVYEVLAPQRTMVNLQLTLNKEIDINKYIFQQGEKTLFTIKVVGIVEPKPGLFWMFNQSAEAFLMPPEIYDRMLEESEWILESDVRWLYVFDFYHFEVENLSRILKNIKETQTLLPNYFFSSNYRTGFLPVIELYEERERTLLLTMQILNLPILILLLFYIFMISGLNIKSEEGIIAVLRSRGASKRQIFNIYFTETLFFGVLALLLGPFVGVFICTIIGSANGFLEFINRTALPLKLTTEALLYALLAFGAFLVTTLIPVISYLNQSIVEQKRQKIRSTKNLWKKYFLDLILIAISLYGLYQMKSLGKLYTNFFSSATELSKDTGAGGVDPLLFISSTLFILGLGLFVLRVYPFVLRGLYALFRSRFSPAVYASFHQILRSGGSESFLMLFIMFTISLGIFNSSTARTLNKNYEDRIRNNTGADIVLQTEWLKYDLNGVPIFEDGLNPLSPDVPFKYIEPAFGIYEKIENTNAARVLLDRRGAVIARGKRANSITVIAVDPYEFGRVVWSRRDLLPYHMNEYMNLLQQAPAAVLLSSNLKEELGIGLGDTVEFRTSVGKYENTQGIVSAFVDYWPGYISGEKTGLIVANLKNYYAQNSMEPYQIWVKKTAGQTDAAVYQNIEDLRIKVNKITSASQQIIKLKNDPWLQGTNGSLTLGFLVSMGVTAIGFLIYWIISIKARALQFGIFRAMGLSKANILSMIITEQLLVSFSAVLFGSLIGRLASELFVPLNALLYSKSEQTIPFKTFQYLDDYLKIFLIVVTIFLLCLVVLSKIILSIKIDQALKLGED